MSERALISAIMVAASECGHRLFRCNTGMGWTGRVKHVGETVVITSPRPLHAGLIEGASDLIGWTREGRFAAIEVKHGRTAVTRAQKLFIGRVCLDGGRAGIVRSVEDALRILEE